jgi:peptidyl-prolyl cis-trans isomerase D
MLIAIRSKVTSWVAKILFLMIALSFAVFGIGDVFRNRQPEQDTVIEVDARKVSMLEFDVAFRNEMQRVGRMFGATLDVQQARALGLEAQTVDRLVNERLFDWLSDELGTSAGDALLRQRIATDPGFKGADGQFSAEIYRQRLMQAGMSESQYLALLAKDIVQSQVVGAITIGANADESVAAILDAYRNERRSAQTITVHSADLVMTLPEPTEEQLAAHYEANKASFTAPEYRALTLAVIDPAKITAEIAVDPAAVESAYQERIDEYRTVETRSIEQAVVSDRAAADAIVAASASVGSLQEAVTAADAKDAVISDADDLTPDGVPDALSTAIFSLAEGTTSQPVQSAFGWHVIRLKSINAPTTKPLEEVKGALEDELRHEGAADRVQDISNKLEDELAGGATLEQAAATVGAAIITSPAIDSTGKLRDGGANAVPQGAKVLSSLFTLAKGATSPVLDADKGELVVGRVDEIVPSAPRPLAEVRDAVAADWQKAQRFEKAKAKAEALAVALKASHADAAALAEGEAGLTDGALVGLRRDGKSDQLEASPPAPAVQAAVFEIKAVGDTQIVAVGSDFEVIKLTEIRSSSADPDSLKAVSTDLNAQVGEDLVEQLVAALRQDAGVSVNQAAIDRYYAPVE